MGLITGTMKWRAVIEGDSPPGLDGQQLQALVTNNLSVGAVLLPFCRNMRVEMMGDHGNQPTMVPPVS